MIRRSYLLSVLALVLSSSFAGCALEVDDDQGAATVSEHEEDLKRKVQCRVDGNCPQPGAPCRVCADGSIACPSAACVQGQCVAHFPQCPPVFDPCAGKGCGERCNVCPPDDPTCLETAVLKFCQLDRSCAALAPQCDIPIEPNPCAFAACPIEPDPCAYTLCPANTTCAQGICISAAYAP